MHFLTAKHVEEIERETQKSWSEITHWFVHRESSTDRLDKRTMEKAPTPGNGAADFPLRKDVLPKLVKGLIQLGMPELDEDYFLNPPDEDRKRARETKSFIEGILSTCHVDPKTQKRLGKENGGLYFLYRRHLSSSELIRELLFISPNGLINNNIYLFNRRGSMYKGVCYRVERIIYGFLFRPHDIFDFAARNIVIHAPALGPSKFMIGTQNRVAKTDGNPMIADFILQKISEIQNLDRIQEICESVVFEKPGKVQKVISTLGDLDLETSTPKTDLEKSIFNLLSIPKQVKFNDISTLE